MQSRRLEKNDMAKILLLGGTGAMGVYLIPELMNLGHDVFVTSRSARKSDYNKMVYIQGNAHNENFISKTLTDKYDAIVDFMVYSTKEFSYRHESLLKNTDHYIFISSARVFAESKVPITEKSPKLLDVLNDPVYLATDEYALAKARQENILRESSYKNWTIVRPTITYSKMRFQLGTLEANTIIVRALNNCPVILPQEMLQKKTAMTWGGDVVKMNAKLVLNPNSFREDFNVCTDEHRTWEEIASYYNKLIGLTVVQTNLANYIKVIGGKYQILYSRMYNRAFDNSKILKATNMQKENFTSIYNGLSKELANCEQIYKSIKINYALNAKIDRITHSHISLKNASSRDKILYYTSYFRILGFLKFVKKYITTL